MGAKSTLEKLEDASKKQTFVRILRKYEDSHQRGYVLATGPRYFLFALVSDRIWFGGFECYRHADVLELNQDPYADFVERALTLRGQTIPKKPPIDMSSIETILESVACAFPLVTIHEENLDPEICHVGRVVCISRGQLSLLEIDPAAEWDESPTEYRINGITRISFGGDYEDALYQVGGEPPKG